MSEPFGRARIEEKRIGKEESIFVSFRFAHRHTIQFCNRLKTNSVTLPNPPAHHSPTTSPLPAHHYCTPPLTTNPYTIIPYLLTCLHVPPNTNTNQVISPRHREISLLQHIDFVLKPR